MRVQFMGVRGSLPSPGPDTVRFGGNTSCVRVDLDADTTVLLDAGTGIVQAGRDLADSHRSITIALTHLHWDHVQGLPFFTPLYQSGRQVEIWVPDPSWSRPLMETMDGSLHCPVAFDDLPARITIRADWAGATVGRSQAHLSSIPANHPGGCVGFRLSAGPASLVYLPDNELDSLLAQSMDDLAGFCRGTDLLIHDAQYTNADMPAKAGWGHSLVSDACRLARLSGAKSLALFHHDPWRTDEQVLELEREAHLALEGTPIRAFAAAEGTSLSLTHPTTLSSP